MSVQLPPDAQPISSNGFVTPSWRYFFQSLSNVSGGYGGLTTNLVAEGSNLYFTNARARSAISVSGSLAYNSVSGVISYTAPTLGTAAAKDTGTSGNKVPLLDGANTWSAKQALSVPVILPASTVAGLPAAATYTNGVAIATDLLAPTKGTIAAGGGAVFGLVVSNGTNWYPA